ncbi:MAG: hypothetical protein AB7O24_24070 [Kofleriaceae bacterium]
MTTALVRRPVIDEDQKTTYAGIWLLKKIDLDPKDGGIEMPVVLPAELSPLDEVLQQMAVDDLISINAKKGRYELTKKGIAYLGKLQDEASDLIDEFEDAETDEVIEELRARNLDPFRAMFLWYWFDEEIDDLVVFQERRGVTPVERMWAFYLMGDEFWRELAKDIE